MLAISVLLLAALALAYVAIDIKYPRYLGTFRGDGAGG